MNEPLEEFENARNEAIGTVDSAFASVVMAFAKYVAKDWKMTEAQWRKEYADDPPTGTYWDGYNAAIDSMIDAAALFTGIDNL
jgi:hypothetical protein